MSSFLSKFNHFQDGENFLIKPLDPKSLVCKKMLPTNTPIGAVIDMETTSLNKNEARITQIGILKFAYFKHRVYGTVGEYEQYNDPGIPIPSYIQRKTGITQEKVQGQSLDWKAIEDFTADCSMIIAHHVKYDRTVLKRVRPSTTLLQKPWFCSIDDIDWRDKYDLTTQSLHPLLLYHGYNFEAHTALWDCYATVKLLMTGSYFQDLIENGSKAPVRLMAVNTPYEKKDDLKGIGCYWDGDYKYWYKVVSPDKVEEEVQRFNSIGVNPKADLLEGNERFE